jgi:hypothetical protein
MEGISAIILNVMSIIHVGEKPPVIQWSALAKR